MNSTLPKLHRLTILNGAAYLLFLFIAFCSLGFCVEKPFVFVVPSYNNANWYTKNLDSIFTQHYENFRLIYIDDASTDGTGPLVQKYLEERGLTHKAIFIQNREHKGSLLNKYKGAWLCDPDEIIVDLDGDDWLYHENVLSYLNTIYNDEGVWVTYGQFVYFPCGTPGWAAQVPEEIIRTNAFRDYPWVTTALRTFYAGLFQKIRKEDFLIHGEFYPMAGDLAFMFPIVEMAGTHSRFIPETLYVYNVATMINDVVKNPEYQKRLGWSIRERTRYKPLQARH